MVLLINIFKTFHGDGLIITTPVFKYYKTRGLIMSDIEYVVEFSRDKPLKDFVDTMTNNRIQATKDGIDELAQLYKVNCIFSTLFEISYSLLSILRMASVG